MSVGADQQTSALARALETRRILLCVGSGGVGKTTTAAALAVEAARRGRKTAVLTVDPAPRLKDALGLGSLGAGPRQVPLGAGAHLDALLLDVKRTFDELVVGLSARPEHARAVLENRLYQNLSGTLAGTAEYMAVEQLYRLAEEDGYEIVVVDTPPARHAVDFLDAPRRLAVGPRDAGRSAAGARTFHRDRARARGGGVRGPHRGAHRRASRAGPGGQ